ncbi:xanthine dehydrogenase subunit XdhA [Desulfatiglans anilini]|uniref:xanthine dehydrogenase subunit XdhA n=1 Tax=Desulfatiglans anilini TaxID=90728 RepID=UPI00041447C7|nr:xanthine dehydrogenase subunit XdhA [Desulfatiglans anilini]
MAFVGTSVSRVDARAKATGRARYVDDIALPGMLHARLLRSRIASGWVKWIDTARAEAIPGVRAVVTYRDVPSHTFPTAGHPFSLDPSRRDIADRHLLTQRIRFYGDEIAAVVAVDEATAERALDEITVEYEERPPLLDMTAARESGTPEIHEGTGNLLQRSDYSFGDVDAALKAADVTVKGRYVTQVVHPCALENHGAVAALDPQGCVVVYTSTQIPHICRRIIGQALGIPWGKVRVIRPSVGGGFGGKQDAVVEPLAAFLTTIVGGRPVKLVLPREDTFVGTRVRHAMELALKSGVRADGTLTFRVLDAHSMNGAYASHGHAIVSKSGTLFRQMYASDAIRFESATVYTNTPTAGAMRGYGAPQVIFATESHMDDIALALGMDPVRLREINLHPEGAVDPSDKVMEHTAALAECLRKGRELIGWEAKRSAGRTTGLKRRGVGMACFCYPTGIYPAGLEVGAARIVLNQDGSVQLQVGAAEIGQGSDTALSQIAADALGIPIDMVHIPWEQDTDRSPYDPGAYASRQTSVSGTAVKQAAEAVKAAVLDRAQTMTGSAASTLDIADGWVVERRAGARLVPVVDVALDSYYNPDTASRIAADVSCNVKTNALAFGCTFVEVEVDTETGRVAILELYNVHDSGRIVNPVAAEGQVQGGVQMGLGYALWEQLLFDRKTGRTLNPNLADYKIMTAIDYPAVSAFFLQTDESTAPCGNKALGEPPIVSVAPAVRNAILHATGIKIDTLPITPERLFFALRDRGSTLPLTP